MLVLLCVRLNTKAATGVMNQKHVERSYKSTLLDQGPRVEAEWPILDINVAAVFLLVSHLQCRNG